jgi:hypothetical protein
MSPEQIERGKPDELLLLIRAIQSDSQGLRELKPELRNVPELDAYASAILGFHQNDLELMETALQSKFLSASLRPLVSLRMSIRSRAGLAEAIDVLIAHLDHLSAEWRAEAEFVVAMGYESLLDSKSAIQFYDSAALHLESIGAHHKALKSRYNSLCHASALAPHHFFWIAKYEEILRRAEELQETNLQGTIRLSIAFEYDWYGMRSQALKQTREAVSCLEPEMGSLNYDHAVLTLCYLCVLEGLRPEAEIHLEYLSHSAHLEVQAAREFILCLFEGRLHEFPSVAVENMSVPWRHRVEIWSAEDRQITDQQLGEIESRVIQILSRTPMTRDELKNALFSDALQVRSEAATRSEANEFSIDQRFDNLLYRIRKKRPGLVVSQAGKYRISDL